MLGEEAWGKVGFPVHPICVFSEIEVRALYRQTLGFFYFNLVKPIIMELALCTGTLEQVCPA